VHYGSAAEGLFHNLRVTADLCRLPNELDKRYQQKMFSTATIHYTPGVLLLIYLIESVLACLHRRRKNAFVTICNARCSLRDERTRANKTGNC
jgi:hypothetical protein